MPGYLRSDANDVFEENSFDSVNKLRTANPQALIDTDFEYGMQTSKWENLALMNNRPFSYQSSNVVPNVSAINLPTNSRTVTVTTSSPHGLSVGSSISVQDTFLSLSNGNFIIESTTGTTFTYTARALNVSTTTPINDLLDPNKTAIYSGTPYTSSRIGGALTFQPISGRVIDVTTTVPHGLSLGSEIAIFGVTASTNAPNGSFSVARIVSSTRFVYYARTIPTGTLGGGSAFLYARPQGQFLHRPFDGGVIFSANASSNNQQAIRQTRRYFRYQSGKGIQISSGTILKPNLSIEAMTRGGTAPGGGTLPNNVITVQTKEQHNLQPGSTVKIFGADQDDYNGEYTIIEILGYNLFQIFATSAPIDPIASGNYYATIDTWYGCSNRLGMFDEQNGVFFEFDGTELYVVRRSSTYQLSGRINVTNNSNLVTRTNDAFPTNFSRQLNPGDFVVIRGQSYRIESISNDSEMTISPSYRGATASFVTFAKTVDVKIKQSEWNLDTMDGLGPSGYNIDLTKMQMFYIDYSWYGAGYIRWGLRGVDGDITYVHKMANNNVNAEAYMRSGNIPARYESNTFAKTTKITGPGNITTIAESIPVVSTAGFADSGTLLIRSGTAYEYVNYSEKTPTAFAGLTREQSGVGVGGTSPDAVDIDIPAGSNEGTVLSTSGIQIGQRVIHPNFPDNTYVADIQGSTIVFNTAALVADPTGVIFSPMSTGQARTFNFSETTPVSVEQAYPTFSASVSHWGTSVIMDGGFDEDKSLIFTFGQTVPTTIPAAVVTPIVKTGTATSGSRVIVLNNSTSLVVGMFITGVGIASETQIARINLSEITLSIPTTANLSSTSLSFTGGNQKSIFSIRVAPSVDNGISALFGQRELINRMQLSLKSVGVISSSTTANLLVTAILNGVPTSSVPWTNIVKNSNILTNSSLSQIADYSGAQNTIILGGEITGGFYLQGTSSIDLDDVRDLGNSVLGGGESAADKSVYPDGPDVLSIVVSNLSTSSVDVLGRLSWVEAQA
jgi:hypothetical protein